MKFERIVEFTPAFDKRHKDPKKNYGIGSVQIKFVLKKGKKAVQFLMGTDWFLPSTIEEYETKGNENLPAPIYLRRDKKFLQNWDLGYHSPKPRYKGQTKTSDDCPYIGGKCYYDGSSLRPDEMKIAEGLIEKGSDFVWELLEKEWKSVFGDEE